MRLELITRAINHRKLTRVSYAPLDILKSSQALQGVYVPHPFEIDYQVNTFHYLKAI